MDTDYKYILNKIFRGSVLKYDLGHEIINFIDLDDNNRYIYVNPRGERNKESKKYTEYVYHIMNTKYNGNTYYELVASSKVDKTHKEINNNITYNNKPIQKIFEYKTYNKKTYPYTFKAESFLKPTKRILLKTGNETISSNPKDNIEEIEDTLIINLICNPKHSRAYSKSLDSITLDYIKDNYLKVSSETINLNNYKDELPFSIISDRTKLEDSLSNEIAYFFNRIKEFKNIFINKFLNINTTEDFTIKREEEHIDLLLESNNNIIVIENKIDSHLHDNQLTKYTNYIREEYSNKTPYYFILMPRVSGITKSEIKENGGSNYKIIYYDELYKLLEATEYKNNLKYKEFLYNEFLYTIKYVSYQESKKEEEVAYIRLKQKLKELEVTHDRNN